jgi:hypothetical protein
LSADRRGRLPTSAPGWLVEHMNALAGRRSLDFDAHAVERAKARD